jgi:hypothetical protein
MKATEKPSKKPLPARIKKTYTDYKSTENRLRNPNLDPSLAIFDVMSHKTTAQQKSAALKKANLLLEGRQKDSAK